MMIFLIQLVVLAKLQDHNKFFKRKMKLEKISNIKYQDGAKMNTVIWALVDETQEYREALISRLQQCEASGDINLSMQVLTLYEKQCLDRCDEDKRDFWFRHIPYINKYPSKVHSEDSSTSYRLPSIFWA